MLVYGKCAGKSKDTAEMAMDSKENEEHGNARKSSYQWIKKKRKTGREGKCRAIA